MTKAKKPTATNAADLTPAPAKDPGNTTASSSAEFTPPPTKVESNTASASADEFINPTADATTDEPAFQTPQPTFEALLAERDTLKSQVEQWKNKSHRSQADADNARKRAQQEIAKARQFGNQGLLKSLLPTLDSLEKGIENCSMKCSTTPLQNRLQKGYN